LNILPDVIKGINGKSILTNDIPIDMDIAEKLRKI